MTVSIVVRAVVEGKRPQTSQGKGRERNVLRTLAATTLQYRSRPVIMPSSRGSEILETTTSAPISWVFRSSAALHTVFRGVRLVTVFGDAIFREHRDSPLIGLYIRLRAIKKCAVRKITGRCDTSHEKIKDDRRAVGGADAE